MCCSSTCFVLWRTSSDHISRPTFIRSLAHCERLTHTLSYIKHTHIYTQTNVPIWIPWNYILYTRRRIRSRVAYASKLHAIKSPDINHKFQQRDRPGRANVGAFWAPQTPRTHKSITAITTTNYCFCCGGAAAAAVAHHHLNIWPSRGVRRASNAASSALVCVLNVFKWWIFVCEWYCARITYNYRYKETEPLKMRSQFGWLIWPKRSSIVRSTRAAAFKAHN